MQELERRERETREGLRICDGAAGGPLRGPGNLKDLWKWALAAIFRLQWPYLGAYLCVVGFCFAAFQHADLTITVAGSLAYLRGHFADFYEYNAAKVVQLNYLPSTFALYAVLALPLKIIGMLPPEGVLPSKAVVFYFKALNSLFYLGTGLVMRSIGRSMGLSERRSDFMMVAWITAPLAVFSQFIFGQYDILTVFFFVCAIDQYLKGKFWTFSALTALSLSFKYFPLFAFVPLLLLAEKRPWHLIAHISLGLSLVGAEVLLYWRSAAFQAGVVGFGAAQRVMGWNVDLGLVQYNMTFFLWSLVCAAALLWEESTPNGERRVAGAFGLLGTAVVFVTIPLHPQWIIYAVPFMTMVAVGQANAKRYFALDMAMMLFFCITTVSFFPDNVDERLWVHGMFSRFNPDIAGPLRFCMANLLPVGQAKVCLAALYAGLLAYPLSMLVRRPGQFGTRHEAVGDDEVRDMWWRSYVGLACWLVPALMAFFFTRYGMWGGKL